MAVRSIADSTETSAATGIAGRRVARVRPGVSSVRGAVGGIALSVVAMSAVAMSAAACHDPECEAARLELARTWETLRATATSRKQIPEASDLSPGEAQERIRVWTTIEERAELMRSSFQTPQVTWPSAEKARADLARAFEPMASKDDPMTRGFALTLNEADQRMASFRKTCR